MENELRSLYIDLIKRCVLGLIYEDAPILRLDSARMILRSLIPGAKPYSQDARMKGQDWPGAAHSMIGLERMNNLQMCVESVIENQVPGDLIETGVWRGGACIFIRALLKAYGIDNRSVWVADSFEGLPAPNAEKYPLDRWLRLDKVKSLAVSIENVQKNFRAYDLLDDQVKFLKGWFSDTLPTAPIDRLAVMRLDGDLYESTMDALVNLYPKLSVGGFVIIDDFSLESCRQAVQDYRAKNGITDEVLNIDWTGVYWQRTS